MAYVTNPKFTNATPTEGSTIVNVDISECSHCHAIVVKVMGRWFHYKTGMDVCQKPTATLS